MRVDTRSAATFQRREVFGSGPRLPHIGADRSRWIKLLHPAHVERAEGHHLRRGEVLAAAFVVAAAVGSEVELVPHTPAEDRGVVLKATDHLLDILLQDAAAAAAVLVGNKLARAAAPCGDSELRERWRDGHVQAHANGVGFVHYLRHIRPIL